MPSHESCRRRTPRIYLIKPYKVNASGKKCQRKKCQSLCWLLSHLDSKGEATKEAAECSPIPRNTRTRTFYDELVRQLNPIAENVQGASGGMMLLPRLGLWYSCSQFTKFGVDYRSNIPGGRNIKTGWFYFSKVDACSPRPWSMITFPVSTQPLLRSSVVKMSR